LATGLRTRLSTGGGQGFTRAGENHAVPAAYPLYRARTARNSVRFSATASPA